MEKRIKQLEEENKLLRGALQEALDKINSIHDEATKNLKSLNEYAHKHYPNINGMYDVTVSYMMNVGRFAWKYRAEQIVGYYIRPILTKALQTS